jgi:uncharacterized membrane protein YeaQ/YmgE (transglycosylase-associated protein family)
MDTDIFFMNILAWMAVGALTGWIAAPLMRFRGGLMLFSMVVGMGGAILGGMLINLLIINTGGYMTQADPGSLLFAFASAGMMLTTIPRSCYGKRSHHHSVRSDLADLRPHSS